jgi:hypothetical protein
MALRIPHLVVPVLLATALATACSSKSPAPDAFVQVQASSSLSGTGVCNFNSQEIPPVIGSSISDAGLTNPVRVPTGTDQGGTVAISCSVAPSGSNFTIALHAEVDTSLPSGGSVTFSGTVDATTGGGNIQAVFVDDTQMYSESDCTISYPAMPPGGPVAAGRIWGQIVCPNAMLSTTATGQSAVTTCQITALFVFENCSG